MSHQDIPADTKPTGPTPEPSAPESAAPIRVMLQIRDGGPIKAYADGVDAGQPVLVLVDLCDATPYQLLEAEDMTVCFDDSTPEGG